MAPVGFTLLRLAVAILMLRPSIRNTLTIELPGLGQTWLKAGFIGLGFGFLTGLFGVGGGFLIVTGPGVAAKFPNAPCQCHFFTGNCPENDCYTLLVQVYNAIIDVHHVRGFDKGVVEIRCLYLVIINV